MTTIIDVWLTYWPAILVLAIAAFIAAGFYALVRFNQEDDHFFGEHWEE